MKKIYKKILLWMAFVVPCAVIFIILYINFLPFGFEEKVAINAGKDGDTTGKFSLEKTSNLGSKQIIDGKNIRFVDGLIYAVYNPKYAVLRNANIQTYIEGDNVYFIDKLDIINTKWDYNWNFSHMHDFKMKGSSAELPKKLTDVIYKSLSKKETQNTNVTDNFIISIDWTASPDISLLGGDFDIKQNLQEISIKKNGKILFTYNIPDYFLDKKHSLLLGLNQNTYYLYIDNKFIQSKNIENIKSVSNFTILKKQQTITKIYTNFFMSDIVSKTKTVDGKNCIYFDGSTQFIFPDSIDKFEKGPFSVYLDWMPEKNKDAQQLIGHFNWEIYQNKNNIVFSLARMDQSSNKISIKYNIDKSFFNKRHNLIATYVPQLESTDEEGYMALYIDGILIDLIKFGSEKLRYDYGTENLTLGHHVRRSPTPYFQGSICDIKFGHTKIKNNYSKQTSFTANGRNIKIPIIGQKGKLHKVSLRVKQP